MSTFKELAEQRYKKNANQYQEADQKKDSDQPQPEKKVRSFVKAKSSYNLEIDNNNNNNNENNENNDNNDSKSSSNTPRTTNDNKSEEATEEPKKTRSFSKGKTNPPFTEPSVKKKTYDELLKEIQEEEEEKKKKNSKIENIVINPTIEDIEGFFEISVDGQNYERFFFYFSATHLEFNRSEDDDRDQSYGMIELINSKVEVHTPSKNIKQPGSILFLTSDFGTFGDHEFQNQKYFLKFENFDQSIEWMQNIALQTGNAEDYEKKLPSLSIRVSELLQNLERDEVEEIFVTMLNKKKISWKYLKSLVE